MASDLSEAKCFFPNRIAAVAVGSLIVGYVTLKVAFSGINSKLLSTLQLLRGDIDFRYRVKERRGASFVWV